MKKLRSILGALLIIIGMVGFSPAVNAQGEPIEAESCDAKWTGEYCDASIRGNCLIKCYPN